VRHTISILVENRFGVLSRVSGLFSGRGFNIESLSVGETLEPTISRMTIVVQGDDLIVEQIKKQLNKLIDVIKVIDLTGEEFVERELILAKVNAEIVRAKVVDVTPKTYTLECTGDESKVTAFIELLRPYGIQEVARTGKVAIARARKVTPKIEKEPVKKLAGKVVGFRE
jgi:acetolactate synthase-1/3 small subunit